VTKTKGKGMALTRDFRDTIQAQVAREPEFGAALFTEALDAHFAGDVAAGKALLRDLVNATIGFERLAEELKKPSKSLHRMLAPRGNPSSENFFAIVKVLQRQTRVKLRIAATIGRR
jgi:DNA-binding phage protein